MAEAWKYRREDITDENGNVVDTALFRFPNVRTMAGIATATNGSYGAGVRGIIAATNWDNAEYRGATPGGRLKKLIRSAAGRGAARNPVMRTNRYGI